MLGCLLHSSNMQHWRNKFATWVYAKVEVTLSWSDSLSPLGKSSLDESQNNGTIISPVS